MEATNELATKNPAEIRSPRICNHFFFCFEREKKEENINLQPCGLRILFSFSEDYETENIRIRRMVFLVVICTNKRKWTIERISRGKFSQQSVNQLFRRAFEE